MTTKPLDDRTPDHHSHNQKPHDRQLADVAQWRCMNCGQHIFVVIDADPPDICEYCDDMTTWKYVKNRH